MSSKANRTKGNKRPSSSANAFNLSLKYGGEQLTFSDLSNFSSLTDESSHPIFAEIKKCHKKDMVTKSKGLKNILKLFEDCDDGDYRFLLKHWIRLFLILSNDNDFQVREISLSTFDQINKLVKSQLMPYLKQIVPHWLCLTGDPHGNIAKLASQSFSSTFAKQKLNDALYFAKDEIIANVNTILFDINYNEKSGQVRLIPGAFQSVIVLSKIAKDDQFLNDELSKLLDNKKFWNYSKFADENVQSSWFNLINSLLVFKFDLVKGHLKQLNQATFSRLGEKKAGLQDKIWNVLFTMMKIDEESCFDELNYDAVFKSFKKLLMTNSFFNQELLVSNFGLLLKYFLLKNENKEQFLNSTFDLFQAEMINNKDQNLSTNLYFESLLFITQNSALISSNQEQIGTILDHLISQRLSSIINQLSENRICLQELFRKLVSFSSSLKSLGYEAQVQSVNKLILKSVKDKLSNAHTSHDKFDLQMIKGLLNIIFNLRAYQSKKKLNLFSPGTIRSLEFIKYDFQFYERTCDLPTKVELWKKVLRLVFESEVKITSDFIEFLNYLVQFSCYLNALDDQTIVSFIPYFKQICQQINSSNDETEYLDKRIPMIRLYYVIHQINLKSRHIDNEFLSDSVKVFSFIFTLQLFSDKDRVDSIAKSALATYNVLFERFENNLAANGVSKLLDQLDEEDHDELMEDNAKNKDSDKLVQRLVKLLRNETELDLVNAIYSFLSLKLDNPTYLKLFNSLIRLNQYDQVYIVNYLILDYLNKNNKILPIKTVEVLVSGFIEFTSQRSLETTSVWSDVLLQALNASTDRQESRNVVSNLSAKFKDLILDNKNSLSFDQVNSTILDVYTFVINLASLDEYSEPTNLNSVIKSILMNENEFEQLKGDLNAKVFEFMWMKNDLLEYNFPSTKSKCLKLPQLANASCASLKVSKLLCFTNDISKFKDAFEDLKNEFTNEQISNLFQSNPNLEYLLRYSSLSYSYLKILNQICSYEASSINDLIENYTGFYEQIFKKLDEHFVKAYAKKIYLSSQEDIWSVTSLHQLLNTVGVENVFDFESISKSLKVNNFSLIMKFINKQNLEMFLKEVIEYNLVNKVNYPDNFPDIKEYLNIIAFCLNDHAIAIDCETYLYPITNCLMAYQEKIQAKKVDDLLYLRDQFNDALLIDSITSCISFLDQFIKRNVNDLSSKFTNFLFYSVLKWCEVLNLEESVLLGNCYLCKYLSHLFSLIKNIAVLLELNSPNLKNARSNWLENYSFKINERLFRFFVKLGRLEIDFGQYEMVNALGKCLVEIRDKNLLKMQLKGLEDTTSIGVSVTNDVDHDFINLKLTNNFKRLFKLLAHFLMKKNSLFSLPSHYLITNYLQLLAAQLNGDVEFLNGLDDKLYLTPPNFLLNLMQQINEELSKDPGFNENANSLKIVYFLIWKQLLDFWEKLDEQIKCIMANYLKDKGLIDELFEHFNVILPIDRHLLAVYYKHGLTKSKIMAYFKEPVHLELTNLWSVNTLYHLSCQIYLQVFKKMPTTMRLWINTAANQSEIKHFTSTFVSDIIIQDELKRINEKASNNFENLKLKIWQSSNEVMASYSFEDIKIELMLTLPANYPIGLIKINPGDRIGVSLEKWRSWELQLTTFLAQNGSVFDGILVWINNIKKTLENHEECCICFFVLQSSNYQLPKITCKNCRKKFHSVCLSKWFAKSNRRNCALCRNEI